ncbi:toll-Interleukin receptor, partial [Escherichia coli]|nr:toll-Interleukin receptor [Escherichia coli]
QVFNTYWEQFENNFKRALDQYPPTEEVKPRTEQDLLSEILQNTRSLNQRIRVLERDATINSINSHMNLTPVEQKDVWYLQKQIDEIIKNGLLDEDEIISFLDKYDIPEKMIRNQIKYTLNQRLSESNKKKK